MSEKQTGPINYRVFRGSGEMSWEKLFAAAAEFASTLHPEQLVGFSHSSDNGHGTVVVWYRQRNAAAT